MPATLPDLLAGLGPLPAHVLRAFEEVPRHRFVAEIFWDEAYKDAALPIGHGVNATKPSVVARVLSLLGERRKVLEIGTGCGWQTALLSTFAETYSIESHPMLYERARRDLAGYSVRLRLGNGLKGWPEHQPFDGIVVCAGVRAPPIALLEQLAPRGVMVVPLGNSERQSLCRVSKPGFVEDFGSCGFVEAAA